LPAKKTTKSPPKRKPKKKHNYVYFIPTGFTDGTGQVFKFLLRPDDRLEHCVTHTVTSSGECDCEGYRFNRRCKHVDRTIDDRPGAVVSLKEARSEVSRLSLWLHTYYVFVDLPSDPYSVCDDGIAEACVRATGEDKRSGCPFPKDGTWRVYMPDSDFKIQVCITELKGFRDAAPPPYYPSIPKKAR